MKVRNNHNFPLVDDFLIDKEIEEIKAGDMVAILKRGDLHDSSRWLEVVKIPDSGPLITKAGNLLIEGEHIANCSITWFPKFFDKYFGGLLSFNSWEEDRVIGFYSEVNCENNLISCLWKKTDGSLSVLIKKEVLAEFFARKQSEVKI